MNIKEIEKIIEILSNSDVNEFELTQDGTTIKLNRGQCYVEAAASVVATEVQAGAPAVAPTPEETVTVNSNFIPVESPIVGTYYSKPSPDSDAFVQVGSKVKKGDKLCIIEAMKLMNEIDSPANGIIEEICLTDSEVVEYGEVLFRISPA